YGGTTEERGKLSAHVHVEGARGCTAVLDVDSEQLLPDGLHLKGTLAFTPANKASNTAWIEVTTKGSAAKLLVDRCSGSFTLLQPNEAALWAKPQGRSTKAALRGPIVLSPKGGDTPSLEIPEPGMYDLAV